ncbi:MAG: hypothetical protein ACTHMG_16890 [Sphingomonas sp.]
MAEPTPPAPPSPPEGTGTPDGGNPAHVPPPAVEPVPGRTTQRESDVNSPEPPREKVAGGKPPAAPKPPTPRRAARPKPVAPRRPRAAKAGAVTVEGAKPAGLPAHDDTAPSRRRWIPALASVGALVAAGAALLSLRGSSRRKAHQADGTDSSKSFEAGIADEGTIPDEMPPP